MVCRVLGCVWGMGCAQWCVMLGGVDVRCVGVWGGVRVVRVACPVGCVGCGVWGVRCVVRGAGCVECGARWLVR